MYTKTWRKYFFLGNRKVVNNHPKVLESAAIGVPSEVGEEDVKLYVIVKRETLSYEEIIDWCQDRMAYFMVPRYVQFCEVFPKPRRNGFKSSS